MAGVTYGITEIAIGKYPSDVLNCLVLDFFHAIAIAFGISSSQTEPQAQTDGHGAGPWGPGCLDSFMRSKLTRSQVQHDSGLIQARHDTQRWNENVKLELQHLAAATPAGTSLVAIQRHVAVTLATWDAVGDHPVTDAVWEEYLHPKWAEQKMRLHGAQEKVLERYFKLEEESAIESQALASGGQVKQASGMNNARRTTQRWLAPIKPHLQHLAAASSAGTSLEANLKHITATLATWDALVEDMAEVSMERHGHAKQLVVFFGADSIGHMGGWGADAVLRACCKVVCRPRGTDQLRSRVALVHEHRTTRVSSAVNGQQPCEEERDHEQPTRRAGWKHPAVKRSKRTKAEQAAEPTQLTGKAQGKAAKAKPAPQPGRWLDRDCNAALNIQRIGESRWRPLELCYWPKQVKLPAKGKEYPGLGYKRLRDKPPKAQQQQQQQRQPAEAQ
ncbi:hypothetical protein QJQ45_015449 [Haematococcus lacustris]|nr:hypothetical protein QJQ45_015449 [Haematococcus lacustris]